MTRQFAQKWLDRSALGVSALCLLHCLFVPLAVSLAPVFGWHLWHEDHSHFWFLALAIPLSVFGLWLGFQGHRRWRLLGLGAVGLGLMYVGLTAGASLQGTAFTMAGVVLVALAHWRNWRLEAARL
ncbi:MAG: MerC domain-containing protein [Sphingomonadales bacterium]